MWRRSKRRMRGRRRGRVECEDAVNDEEDG